MKKVIVASRNPVKIEAARIGFEKMFPEENFVFEGASVPSGVADQPMTDAETLRGAMQRAKRARSEFAGLDYWVGIEGGIEREGEEMTAFAWVVVLSASAMGKARTAAFFLPPRVVALVGEGMELGDADDIVFGQTNSKQSSGAVGLLTNNVMDRTSFYVDGVVLALIAFKNEDLYQL